MVWDRGARARPRFLNLLKNVPRPPVILLIHTIIYVAPPIFNNPTPINTMLPRILLLPFPILNFQSNLIAFTLILLFQLAYPYSQCLLYR